MTAAPASSLPMLQYRPFRMLSFSRFLSRVASNSLNFALVLLIVEETERALMSALLVLALVVPSTVAGIAAGAAADGFPKRLQIFLANLLRAAVCVAFATQGASVAGYFVVAIMLSTVTQFASSAEGAILPAIVQREDLARANAVGHAVTGIAQIVGFVILTPLMLRLVGSPDALFLVAAGLFTVAGFYALFIGRQSNSDRKELGGIPRDPWYAAGWREMRRDHRVFHAAVELTVIAAALIILGGLIPTYITDVLDLPIEVGVVVLLPAALGVALGLQLANFLARRIPVALLSRTGFLGFIVFLFLISFVEQEAKFLGGYGAFAWLNSVSIGSFDGAGVLAAVFVAPLGFFYALVAVAAQTVLNSTVPLHLQGRVLATQGAMAAVASSVPVLAAGALTDLAGVTFVMALLAVAISLVAFTILRGPQRLAVRPAVVGR
jgi:MFS family permease